MSAPHYSAATRASATIRLTPRGPESRRTPQCVRTNLITNDGVSLRIRQMPFLWLPVDDPPGPSSDRSRIEVGTIALLSNLSNPAADRPSLGWIGNHSSREEVAHSGLWNVNHVRNLRKHDTLRVLEYWVHRF